jgi:hypothetical protein
MRGAILGTILLATIAGCASGPRGPYFGRTAFYPRREHYRVAFEEGGDETCRLLSDAWILENYARDGDPCNRRPLGGVDRRIHYELDHDSDGRPDVDTIEARFDLRFEHREDGSQIWIRTIPMDPDLADRALDVLAEEYLDHLSGTALVEVELDRGVRVRADHPHVVRVVSAENGTLGGEPAHQVTFDLLDADRVDVDPSYVPDRVTLVLFRPGEHSWWSVRRGIRSAEWPMIVVLGYSARADRWDTHWPEYQSFVGRTRTTPME